MSSQNLLLYNKNVSVFSHIIFWYNPKNQNIHAGIYVFSFFLLQWETLQAVCLTDTLTGHQHGVTNVTLCRPHPHQHLFEGLNAIIIKCQRHESRQVILKSPTLQMSVYKLFVSKCQSCKRFIQGVPARLSLSVSLDRVQRWWTMDGWADP